MNAPAPRLYVPEPEDPPHRDPRAFRHAPPGPGRPQGPARAGKDTRKAAPRGGKPGGRPPQGPGGPGGSGRSGPPKGPRSTAASAPLPLRLALLPVRLALVPLRLAGLVLGRITGGRPWLALVLVLGCGVIFLHAATLKTNQLIEQRDAKISALERSTAALRNSVAELGSTDRVSRVGREAGMVFPDPEGIGYLDASKARAERAAKTFGPPSAAWLPAPNRSSQNGDAVNEDGTVAEDGLGGTAGQAATGTDTSTGTGTAGAGVATGDGSTAADPAAGITTGAASGAATGTGTGTPAADDTATTSGTGATGEAAATGQSTGATGTTGAVSPETGAASPDDAVQ